MAVYVIGMTYRGLAMGDQSPTATQIAVLRAAADHCRVSFLGVTADAWWRAREPFRGGRATFSGHLRVLDQLGLLAPILAGGRGRRITPDGLRVLALLDGDGEAGA